MSVFPCVIALASSLTVVSVAISTYVGETCSEIDAYGRLAAPFLWFAFLLSFVWGWQKNSGSVCAEGTSLGLWVLCTMFGTIFSGSQLSMCDNAGLIFAGVMCNAVGIALPHFFAAQRRSARL